MNKLTNASFSQLVVQYERLVYTVCFQLVRDAAAAEDLTQETFLSAYLHRDAIPPGHERQWLCRVATNKAKDYLQSAYQRHTLLPGEDGIPPGQAPGRPVKTIHTQLSRGKRMLREALERSGNDDMLSP